MLHCGHAEFLAGTDAMGRQRVLLAHGLLVLEHIAIGTALHGIAPNCSGPWALRHRAWDLGDWLDLLCLRSLGNAAPPGVA